MLSKNNKNERLRKMENKNQRFSIRKLSVGAASVVIGLFLAGIENHTVEAADVQSDENGGIKSPTDSSGEQKPKAKIEVKEQGQEQEQEKVLHAKENNFLTVQPQNKNKQNKTSVAQLLSSKVQKSSDDKEGMVTKKLSVTYKETDQYDNPIMMASDRADITTKINIKGHSVNGKFKPVAYQTSLRDGGKAPIYNDPKSIDPASFDPDAKGQMSDWISVDDLSKLTYKNSNGVTVDPLSYGAGRPDGNYSYSGFRLSDNKNNVIVNDYDNFEGNYTVIYPLNYMLEHNLDHLDVTIIANNND